MISIKSTRTPSRALLAIVALAATFLSACSSAGGGGVASLSDAGSASGSDSDVDVINEEAVLAMAQCMRDAGWDFPDPTFDENGRPLFGEPGEGGLGRDDPDFQDDMQRCRQENGIEFGAGRSDDPQAQAERQDRQQAMAACLREKGYDVPDPQSGEPGGFRQFFDDEEAGAALQECAQELGFEGGPGGPPPGGGAR